MRSVALIGFLLLAGCQSAPIKPPKVVEVVVEKIVPVPAKLTEPCEVYQVKSQTYGQAIEAANKRKASLEACNAKLAEIRGLVK